MKFKCRTREERWKETKEREAKWKKRFCLIPAHFTDGTCVWLEYIETRRLWDNWGFWNTEYRMIHKDKP